jgi:hypothetical protein
MIKVRYLCSVEIVLEDSMKISCSCRILFMSTPQLRKRLRVLRDILVSHHSAQRSMLMCSECLGSAWVQGFGSNLSLYMLCMLIQSCSRKYAYGRRLPRKVSCASRNESIESVSVCACALLPRCLLFWMFRLQTPSCCDCIRLSFVNQNQNMRSCCSYTSIAQLRVSWSVRLLTFRERRR